MTPRMSYLWTLSISILSMLSNSMPARSDEHTVVSKMFSRLAGYPLSLDDPRRITMENFVKAGTPLEAAKIATEDSGFFNITLKQWASPMSNQALSTQVPLNDFIATIIGITRDNLDFRGALTENIYYTVDTSLAEFTAYGVPLFARSNNNMFNQLDLGRFDLKRYLVKGLQSTFLLNNSDSGGLLTTRAWAEAHLQGGTNRRAIAFAFENFLCRPIDAMRVDATVPDDRVRRDVDRTPSGDNAVYQSTCRGCHATMDALGGAYAYMLFDPASGLMIQSGLAEKMNQNATNYPAGFVTTDNNWVARFTANQLTTLINRPDNSVNISSGTGVKSLGSLLTNSRAFASCMAKRVFENVCVRPATALDDQIISKIASDFVTGGYKLKSLFEETASLSICVGL